MMDYRSSGIGHWNWLIAVSSARFNANMVKTVFMNWQSRPMESIAIHELIFCASNLALATELYLKATLVSNTGQAPKNTHNLGELYDSPPASLEMEIDSRYKPIFEERYANLTKGEVWIRLDEGPLPTDKRPTTLNEVLHHYSSDYVDWRYIFALNSKKQPSNLRGLHYSRLMCLCEAIDGYLQATFPQFIKATGIQILK